MINIDNYSTEEQTKLSWPPLSLLLAGWLAGLLQYSTTGPAWLDAGQVVFSSEQYKRFLPTLTAIQNTNVSLVCMKVSTVELYYL